MCAERWHFSDSVSDFTCAMSMPTDAVQVGALLLETMRNGPPAQHAEPSPCVDAPRVDDLASLGLQLFEAMMGLAAQQTEPAHNVVTIVGAPAGKPQEPPLEIQALMRAVEHMTTEEEVLAAVDAFAEAKVAEVLASSNPLETLNGVVGSETVTAILEVAAAAIADLDAATAATDEPITDQAAARIVHTMVRRIIRRADRPERRRPMRERDVRCRNVLRVQRARRARHRRAARLSAVASAGDGPSPPEPPPAVRGGREHARLARLQCELTEIADNVPPASEVRR